MEVCKKHYRKFNLLLLIIFLIDIKPTIEIQMFKIHDFDSNSPKNMYLRSLQTISSSNLFSTVIKISNEDSLNSIISIPSDSTNITEDLNSTFIPITINKKSGLSTGGIIAIVIPCALLLIGVTLATIFFKSLIKTPITPMVNTHNSIPVIESSMNTLNEPKGNKAIPQEIHNIQNINLNQQGYSNNKEDVIIPIVHRVKGVYVPMNQNQNILPIQQVVVVKQAAQPITKISQVVTSPQISIVQPIPSINISQVSQASQISMLTQTNQISQMGHSSQISQVSQSPLISHVNVNHEPEKILSHSIISTKPQRLPDINTSQISESKVMPLEVLPQVNRQNKVEILPVKILPPILQKNEVNSNLIAIPQIKKSENF